MAPAAGATVLPVSPPRGGPARRGPAPGERRRRPVTSWCSSTPTPSRPRRRRPLVAVVDGRTGVGPAVVTGSSVRYEAVSIGPGAGHDHGRGHRRRPRRRWWRGPWRSGRPGPAGSDRTPASVATRRAGAVAEDVALAQRAAAAGVPVTACSGRRRSATGCTPGARAVRRGVEQAPRHGGRRGPAVRLVATVTWVAAVLRAATLAVSDPGPGTGLASVAFAVQFGVLARRLGRFGWAARFSFPSTSSPSSFCSPGPSCWRLSTARRRGGDGRYPSW